MADAEGDPKPRASNITPRRRCRSRTGGLEATQLEGGRRLEVGGAGDVLEQGVDTCAESKSTFGAAGDGDSADDESSKPKLTVSTDSGSTAGGGGDESSKSKSAVATDGGSTPGGGDESSIDTDSGSGSTAAGGGLEIRRIVLGTTKANGVGSASGVTSSGGAADGYGASTVSGGDDSTADGGSGGNHTIHAELVRKIVEVFPLQQQHVGAAINIERQRWILGCPILVEYLKRKRDGLQLAGKEVRGNSTSQFLNFATVYEKKEKEVTRDSVGKFLMDMLGVISAEENVSLREQLLNGFAIYLCKAILRSGDGRPYYVDVLQYLEEELPVEKDQLLFKTKAKQIIIKQLFGSDCASRIIELSDAIEIKFRKIKDSGIKQRLAGIQTYIEQNLSLFLPDDVCDSRLPEQQFVFFRRTGYFPLGEHDSAQMAAGSVAQPDAAAERQERDRELFICSHLENLSTPSLSDAEFAKGLDEIEGGSLYRTAFLRSIKDECVQEGFRLFLFPEGSEPVVSPVSIPNATWKAVPAYSPYALVQNPAVRHFLSKHANEIGEELCAALAKPSRDLSTMTDIEKEESGLSWKAGSFTTIAFLGHGAFAAVVSSVVNGGKEVVAVKYQLYAPDEVYDLFLRPLCLQVLAATTSDNVLPLYTWFCANNPNEEKEGKILLATVLQLGSHSLKDEIESHHANEITDSGVCDWILRTTFEILTAQKDWLKADPKIVHRALKPENFLRCSPGHLKAADFGLACLAEDTGTRYFMAPECRKGKYSAASDMYSIGGILYQLLTGDTCTEEKVYFQSSLKKMLAKEAYQPRKLLMELCLEMVQEKPEDRIKLEDALAKIDAIQKMINKSL